MVRSISLVVVSLLVAGPACSKKADQEGAAKKTAEAAAGDTPAAAGEAPPPAAGSSPCDKVPASLVSEVLQQPGFAASNAETQGPVTVCKYERTGQPRSVTLRIETGSHAAAAWDTYKEQVKDYEVKDIPGLGDKAYRYTMGGMGDAVGNNVVVLKGQSILQVSQLGGDPARLVELGRRIAAAL